MSRMRAFALRCARFEHSQHYGWMSQDEIARLLPAGFSVRTWQDWVQGRRCPPQWVQVLVVDHLERVVAKRSAYKYGTAVVTAGDVAA